MVNVEMYVSDIMEIAAKRLRKVPKGHFPVANKTTDSGIVNKACEISVKAKDIMK